ncbi:MAG TPA: hypothetical protein VG674_08590 [Amycolatopsis sp.]|nr:hypothetical protein [Amycolatopsis sp.]
MDQFAGDDAQFGFIAVVAVHGEQRLLLGRERGGVGDDRQVVVGRDERSDLC